MVRSRRSWFDVVAGILDVADEETGVNKTHIVYKANLNFRRLEKYLGALMQMGLIEECSAREALFKTTAKGREFLNRYRKIQELI